MKKQINSYLSEIKALLNSENNADWEKVLKDHLIKIGFYQHERLIHLIVTVVFALLEIISLFAYFTVCSIFMLILALLFLVLLIPYVFHYYFLENSVQELYLLYDEIKKRL